MFTHASFTFTSFFLRWHLLSKSFHSPSPMRWDFLVLRFPGIFFSIRCRLFSSSTPTEDTFFLKCKWVNKTSGLSNVTTQFSNALNLEMKFWGKVSQKFVRKTKRTYHWDCKCSFALVLKKENKGRKITHWRLEQHFLRKRVKCTKILWLQDGIKSGN